MIPFVTVKLLVFKFVFIILTDVKFVFVIVGDIILLIVALFPTIKLLVTLIFVTFNEVYASPPLNVILPPISKLPRIV